MAIVGRPRRNADCTNAKRQRDFNKRLTEEKADAERIRIETEPDSKKEWIANYLERKTLSDHITREIINQVFGKRMGVPTTGEQKYLSRLGKDYISAVLGQIQDESEALSISREIHANSNTGDIDWVFYNAKREADLQQRLDRDETYEGKMDSRNEQRVKVAQKPWETRKKIRKIERISGLNKEKQAAAPIIEEQTKRRKRNIKNNDSENKGIY